MANKQPFYHEVRILYTTTYGAYLTKPQREKLAKMVESFRRVVKGSVEVHDDEPQPGDPADLL